MKSVRPQRHRKDNKMLLDNLPLPLLERAFQYLCNPLEQQPPQELSHLSNLQWYALQNLLQALLWERELHPLQ